MASKRFQITYPDGSRKKVSAFRVAQLCELGELKQIGSEYRYLGPTRTFHTFIDLAQWHTAQLLSPEEIKRYLERLEVIHQLGLEREWQAEETPEGFNQRLLEMGMPATGFEAVA